MSEYNIGNIDQFPEGEVRAIEVNGINIAIVNIDNELYGIQNLCTHKRYPLSEAGQKKIGDEENNPHHKGEYKRGEINKENRSIRCPWHRLEWELETGENRATNRCIATYDVHTEGEEVIVQL